MDQSTVAVLLLIIVTALLLVIFTCLYYLWGKTRKLEALAKKNTSNALPAPQGSIYGYAGKELFEMLKGRNEEREKIAEIKKSYIFYLTRHLEAALEQGLIDAEKSRSSDLQSEMAVGGTRGEIMSWLPVAVLAKFYAFGRDLVGQSDQGDDAEELKASLNLLVSDFLAEIDMASYAPRVSEVIARKYINEPDD